MSKLRESIKEAVGPPEIVKLTVDAGFLTYTAEDISNEVDREYTESGLKNPVLEVCTLLGVEPSEASQIGSADVPYPLFTKYVETLIASSKLIKKINPQEDNYLRMTIYEFDGVKYCISKNENSYTTITFKTTDYETLGIVPESE